jgi:hypothetical protein
MNCNESTSNGQPPRDPRGAASYYLTRGWRPIPVPFKSKAPDLKDWPNLNPSEADLDNLFPADQSSNIGLLLGVADDNLIDADLDAHEAIEAAKVLMPRTRMMSGRKSKPLSHLWYRTDHPPDKASEAFKDPIDQKMIVELRSCGAQTIVPWSVHESGETIGWYDDVIEPSWHPIEMLKQTVRYT